MTFLTKTILTLCVLAIALAPITLQKTSVRDEPARLFRVVCWLWLIDIVAVVMLSIYWIWIQ